MIYINKALRVRKFDKLNLVLEELSTNKAQGVAKAVTKFRIVGYYSDLKSALIGALNKKLFDSAENEMTIKETISAIEQAKQEVLTAINQTQGEKQV